MVIYFVYFAVQTLDTIQTLTGHNTGLEGASFKNFMANEGGLFYFLLVQVYILPFYHIYFWVVVKSHRRNLTTTNPNEIHMLEEAKY